MHGLEAIKRINAEKGEKKVCPRCEGDALKPGKCAGFYRCEKCGWIIHDDS